MQKVLIHLTHPSLLEYCAIWVGQESPTLQFVVLERELNELTLKQLQMAILSSPVLLEYFSEREQFYRTFISVCDGLLYLESKGLTHGDLTPCAISASGKLLDYLHINELVRIAQGRQKMIYDAPSSFRTDMWALGVSLFEFCYSVEKQ